jgi:hypothetical protein
MEPAFAVRKIPFDRLVPSPANARKTPPSAAEDAELKTRGLKQNLVVCPSLEVMTAFTLAPTMRPSSRWHQVKDQSYIQPYTARRLLTEGAVPPDSRLGAFVGATACEPGGGTLTRDLFSGDDEGFMDDAALVRRLASAKLEAEAKELRPRWA